MAYTYSLHWNGASGTKSQESGNEYDAEWRVITDNPLDQAQRVIERFEIDRVRIGDAYYYANDSDPGSVAKSIKPVREKGSTDTWVVKVHYAPPEAGESNNEIVIEDLPLRCEDVSMTTIQHQKPVERAIYQSGLKGKAATIMTPGTVTIPLNSAFVPFNPGLEKDVAGLAIRIVRRLATVDGTTILSSMNLVNSDAFTISHCGFVMDVLSYQARIVAAAVALRTEEGNTYWEVPITMEIIDNWHDFVVDRGVSARAIAEDHDGRGGSLNQTDMIAGVPRLRELTDIDETPIADPVLLNGDGQPLDISTGIMFIDLEYQKYTELDFSTLGFLSGLLEIGPA